MTAASDLVNRALEQIAAEYSVTGSPPTFDGSAAGLAAGALYTPGIATLLRGQDFEFARTFVTLSASGNTAPLQWSQEYLYPADCLRVRQVYPASWVALDPQPIRWDVGDALVSAVPTKVIWANIASAKLLYTTSAVSEAQFDALFAESFVRYLASELAMALSGRLDTGRKMLEDSGQMAQIGMDRDT